ncbi:hypothetical protein ACN08Z_04605 [Rothia sp. P7181]
MANRVLCRLFAHLFRGYRCVDEDYLMTQRKVTPAFLGGTNSMMKE